VDAPLSSRELLNPNEILLGGRVYLHSNSAGPHDHGGDFHNQTLWARRMHNPSCFGAVSVRVGRVPVCVVSSSGRKFYLPQCQISRMIVCFTVVYYWSSSGSTWFHRNSCHLTAIGGNARKPLTEIGACPRYCRY